MYIWQQALEENLRTWYQNSLFEAFQRKSFNFMQLFPHTTHMYVFT